MAPNSSPPLLEIEPPASSNPQTDYGSDFDLSALLEIQARDAPTAILPAGGSEYGSDFDTNEQLLLAELLNELEDVDVKSLVIDGLEDDVTDVTNLAKVPKYSSQGSHQTASTQYFSAQEEPCPQPPGNHVIHDSGIEAEERPSYFARMQFGTPSPLRIR
jgi:hypothetical protein